MNTTMKDYLKDLFTQVCNEQVEELTKESDNVAEKIADTLSAQRLLLEALDNMNFDEQGWNNYSNEES